MDTTEVCPAVLPDICSNNKYDCSYLTNMVEHKLLRFQKKSIIFMEFSMEEFPVIRDILKNNKTVRDLQHF